MVEFRVLIIVLTAVMFMPALRLLPENRAAMVICAAFGFSQMTFSVEWRRRSIVALLSLPIRPRVALFGKIAAHWAMMLVVVDFAGFFVFRTFYEAFLVNALAIASMTFFATLMIVVDYDLVPVVPMALVVFGMVDNYEAKMAKLHAFSYFYPAIAGLVFSLAAALASAYYFEWKLVRKGFTSLEGW